MGGLVSKMNSTMVAEVSDLLDDMNLEIPNASGVLFNDEGRGVNKSMRLYDSKCNGSSLVFSRQEQASSLASL